MRLRTLIRRMLPRPFLRLFHRHAARRYISNLDQPIDSTRKTILIVNHYYDQDIRALGHANREYNIVVVDGPRLFNGGKIYFDSEVMQLKAPYDRTPENKRAMFRDDCRSIFESLQAKLPFDLIVTASDNFWWIREFIKHARGEGVKTVVLDKEGTRSPYAVEGETERIRKFSPFMSDHLFVWSMRQRKFWNKAGVSDDKITVIGQPRSDLFFKERRREVDRMFPAPRPLVTLFSYEDTAYIPPAQVSAEGPTWRRMKRETHDTFGNLAEAHPEYNFVIKAHPQQSDLKELRRRYDRDNLLVIGGSAVANELIRRSELIIAFQTTAVIESMMLGKRVLYTAWDEHYPRFAADLLPFHEAPGIVAAESFDRFRDVCKRFFSGNTDDFSFSSNEEKARRQFVDEYLYNSDGNVCRRFYTHVGRMI